jgi:4-amino-4-deoxy-L-arabinose transferase-like glycosyltransferase
MIKSKTLFLGWLLALALGLRLWGINYGLPFAFGNIDETIIIVNPLGFLAGGTGRPSFFEYPALYSYISYFVYLVYFWIGQMAGNFSSVVDVLFAYAIAPGKFYLLLRTVTACLGTATVYVTFRIGRIYLGNAVGYIAALILAISPLHVAQSHWALPDVPMVLFSTVALYFIFGIARTGKPNDYLFTALFSGLAISTKYNAALVIIPFVIAHWLRCRAEGRGIVATLVERRLITAGVILIASFLLGSPYWILDFNSYFSAYVSASTHMRVGHLGIVESVPWIWIIPIVLSSEGGLGILFVGALIYSLICRRVTTNLLLIMIGVAVFYIGTWGKAGLHYFLPIWPPLALLTARVLEDLCVRLQRRRINQNIVLSGFVVVVVLPLVLSDALMNFKMTNEDTRSIAKRWIEDNLPVYSSIALTMYSYNPPLGSDKLENATDPIHTWANPVFQERLARYFATVKTYRLVPLWNEETANDNGAGWKTINQLRVEGVQYIILSSDVYQRYLDGTPPPENHPLRADFDRNRAYFEYLLNSHDLEQIKEFIPDAFNLGPVLKLYALKENDSIINWTR